MTSPILKLLRERPAIWAAVYVVVTAVLLSPWFISRGVPLALGHPAPADVVAERDVTIPDEEESAARRHRAELEAPLVYDLDSRLAASVDGRIAAGFSASRGITARRGTDGWWEQVRTAFDLPISRAEAEAFAERSFAPSLEEEVRGAARAAYARGIVGIESGRAEGGRLLRDLESGREQLALSSDPRPIAYESGVRAFVAERLAPRADEWPAPLRREVVSFVARCATPNVNYNARETERRKHEAADRAGEVYIRIPRGGVVVRAGEVVTPSAARLAQAVTEAGQENRWLRLAGGTAFTALLAILAWPLLLRAAGTRRRAVPAYSAALFAATGAFVVNDGLARLLVRFGGGEADLFQQLVPALPHAAGAFLAGLVAGAPAAAIATVLGSSATGILFGESFRWIAYPLAVGLAASFAFERPRSRGAVIRAGFFVGLIAVTATLSLRTLDPSPNPPPLWAEALAAFASGPLSAAVAASLVPALEAIFGIATDLRLLELGNQNLPLLRRLAVEAPGTYQHSLLVAILAEPAAEAVGANPLLVRVGAYYHDIGKMTKSSYFVENAPRGQSRHDRLAPSMSALVIANHVREGVVLAREARLPEVIVDAIQQHHGTKPIRFFYQKALALASEPERVDEEDFRHTGPKPTTREWGILLLADAVEAASRTLVEPTPSRLASVVEAIVEDAVRDGQLDECQLTFEDLEKIRGSFLRSLAALYHHRIDYPGFDFNKFAERRKRHSHDGLARRAASPAGPRRA